MTPYPTSFLVLEDFLSAQDRAALIRFVREDSAFSPAQVTVPGALGGESDNTLRSAEVTDAVGEMFGLFEDKLGALLPHVRREIDVAHFSAGRVERQITAHGDGNFFGLHSDVGDPWAESASRRVSFVYYFHEHPRTFDGGELRLWDTEHHADGTIEAADTFQTVEPIDNSIVFFPSDAYHEVRPVRVEGDTKAPGAKRFTVNGWFHDRNHVRSDPPLEPDLRTALTQRYTPSFTDTGFLKVKTPAAIHRALRAIYDERLGNPGLEPIDEIYLPTGIPDFLPIEDVKAQFQLALQPLHEEWSGQELIPTAAYGLRVYRSGQTLIPHTDTLATHVISSIVHIAHETTEPWPLWIVDLHGNEHDVILEEGEMLLYESARCPHARSVPLAGSSYCSLFLHYRPVDWNVTYWSLIDKARADGATDVLPPALWPAPPQTTDHQIT